MGDAAVIGAGVLGLGIAQRLQDRGHDVTVFEASPHLGGLASVWELGNARWDRHYHVMLPTDSRTRQLLRSIDLEPELRWKTTRSALYAGPEYGIRPFSSPLDLLRLPNLGLVEKIRLAGTILAGSRPTGVDRCEDQSAQDWLTRRSGRRAFDRFWQPLLSSKLANESPHASAAFVAATMRRLRTARGGVLKSERYGYVPGGYGRVFDRYAGFLTDAGVKIDAGVPVRSVQASGGRLRVELDDAEATFDRVIVTTAAPLASDLCPGLTADEHATLRAVRYIGVVCASLLLPYRLSRSFVTYVTDSVSPFSAVVEMTAVVDPAELDGWHLVYLPCYAAADSRLFETSDEDLRQRLLFSLRSMYPHLDTEDLGAFRVSRVRHVFAVPTVGYSRTMPATTTTIAGLQLIGSANLPFATLNVDDTLSLLQEVR